MPLMPRATHPLLRSLGAAIRSLRRERGMSQESLAGLADIDRSYMSSVERGLRNVSVLNVARIAEALGVPVWELFRPRPAAHVILDRPTAFDAEIGLDPLPPMPVNAAARERGGDWEPRYLSLG
jgi:transcriptional regulator with XRE-family HTH domain